MAYWFNDDTEEIEMVNQSDGDNESQVVLSLSIFGFNHMLSVELDRDESRQYEIKEARLDAQQEKKKSNVQILFFRFASHLSDDTIECIFRLCSKLIRFTN